MAVKIQFLICVVTWQDTNVSEDHAAPIFKVL